ncbi:MAG: CHASE2 domain-containing protein, partial [Burkholderiales bacterium]
MSSPGWRRLLRSETLPVGALVLLVLVPLLLTDVLGRADLVIYDWCVRSFARPPRQDIVIVAVDEPSLQRLGRWPWSRRVHAQLVDRLTRFEARSVALDLLFVEPEVGDPEADRALAAAIAANGRVVLPVAPARLGGGLATGELKPLPELAQAAARLGHVDVRLDDDAIARGAFLWAGMGTA